jgi:hypothetical protein
MDSYYSKEMAAWILGRQTNLLAISHSDLMFFALVMLLPLKLLHN